MWWRIERRNEMLGWLFVYWLPSLHSCIPSFGLRRDAPRGKQPEGHAHAWLWQQLFFCFQEPSRCTERVFQWCLLHLQWRRPRPKWLFRKPPGGCGAGRYCLSFPQVLAIWNIALWGAQFPHQSLMWKIFFMTPAEIEATAHQAVALSHVRLHWFLVPFGYLTVRHGKSQFLIGKPSINGPFSMAMLNSQMVNQPIFKLSSCHLF